MRLIIGISGGSGAIYALGLLQTLKLLGIEIHLVMTKMGEDVVKYECGLDKNDLMEFAKQIYSHDDLYAPIASGTFRTEGMVIIPCSMKTLAAVANGYSDNLLSRSADVVLKERRKLVVVPRETPLSTIHLKNMLELSKAGAVIMPAAPGFYTHPQSISDMVAIMTGKVLDAFDIDHDLIERWGEKGKVGER